MLVGQRFANRLARRQASILLAAGVSDGDVLDYSEDGTFRKLTPQEIEELCEQETQAAKRAGVK